MCLDIFTACAGREEKNLEEIMNSGALSDCTFIGGDFNCVPECALDTLRDSTSRYSNEHSRELESYLSGIGLTDQMRRQQGRARGPFTCLRAGTQSATRIDRIYVKNRDGIQWDMGVLDDFGLSAHRTQPDPTEPSRPNALKLKSRNEEETSIA